MLFGGFSSTRVTKSNISLMENPYSEKLADFPYVHVENNGVDLPHLAKRAFRDQIGPNVQKAMLLGSPSHQGLKNCGFSQKFFSPF